MMGFVHTVRTDRFDYGRMGEIDELGVCELVRER